jgi:hypothetical protein
MAEISGVQPVVTPKNNSSVSTSLNQVKSEIPNTIDNSTPIADPNRVVRTNDQNVNTGEHAYKYGTDSNFENFARTLLDMPDQMDIYNDVFMTKLTNEVNLVSYGKDFAEQVFQFMQAINMSPEELLSLMKEQNLLENKFTGPFFDIIRNLMSNGSSRELTMTILDFLKRYDAYTSNEHTENVMLSNLQSIASNIPHTKSAQLLELLQQYPENGTQADKLNFMKNDVMPFLTKYVSQTHDYGVVREMIAMFAVSLGKYETGSEESFAASFRNIAGYLQIMGMLDGVDAEVLQERLVSTADTGSKGTEILDAFVNILSEGMKGTAGVSNKSSFQDMISSLLINESVYMPLTHLVVPANIDGNMIFSEMWIDPDADDNDGGSEGDSGNRASKIFVKFVIKELGNFDLLILERDGKVNMELHYPEVLQDRSSDIRKDVNSIVSNNNLTIDTLKVSKGQTDKNLLQIFPKIFAQKTSVDVSV